MAQCGVVLGGCEVRESGPGRGKGLFATKDIEEDEASQPTQPSQLGSQVLL